MRVISKQMALDLITRSIKEASSLPDRYFNASDGYPWETWIRTFLVRMRAVFPGGSEQLGEIEKQVEKIYQRVAGVSSAGTGMPDLGYLLAILRAYATEIEELWSDTEVEPNEEGPRSKAPEHSTQREVGNKVFLVHGHDHGTMQAVARFIEQIGLEAVILHEQISGGNTVIEKLEGHGQVEYCVVLLTPDDIGAVASDRDNLRPRARQNVVLELGYFMGRLGRRKTCALVAGGVEIPSDYSGVVYIPLDNEEAWKIRLAKELRASGLGIDANRILSNLA